MRKTILTVGIALGALLLIIGAVLIYAIANLNSIIASRQKMLLDKLSDVVGRPVEIAEIKASLGWGVSIAISGLKIADDPAFSQLPFVAANQVSAAVELLPLLGGNLKITRLVFDEPQIRVLRDAQGQLNVSTIGRGKEKAAPEAAPPEANLASENKGPGALNALSIENFSIAGGSVYYSDAQDRGAPIQIKRLDLDVSDFSATAPFGVKLKLAALGDQQNLNVAGKAGPILSYGSIDPGKLPLELKVGVGPLLLDKLRGAAQIGPKIPAKLSMPDPISIDATLRGSLDDLAFDFTSDLSAARVVYIGLFNKPAGTLLKLVGNGARKGAELAVAKANAKLADLDLSATKVVFGNPMSAQIDTNRFDLATLGPMIAAMAKYNASGKAEIHAAAQVEAGRPSVEGTIALAGVALKPEGSKLPGITDLSGKVSLTQNAAVVEPTNFMIGSGHANLEARAESIDPLRATYSFKADSLKLAEFVAGRPAGEVINQLSVTGSADGEIASPSISARVISANGKVSNVTYQNLAMISSYTGKTGAMKSLNVQTFGGTVAGDTNAVFGDPMQVSAALATEHIDLKQALAAQGSSAAKIVRGLLTSQLNISAKGSTFDQMKPTFGGGGKIAVADGKLVGVNVVAEALNKINGLPQIGALVSPGLLARHPELFNNPDTDLTALGMTFQMSGPRITSHDIVAATQDYRIMGEGWFDLDKQIDLNARLVMSKGISGEIVAEKKNVEYVTNQDGEIDIPLLIRGTLPKPSVTPDVNSLVQRAASRALEREGSRAINKLLEKKGLGGLLGGGSSPGSPGAGGAGQQPAPSNPLAPLRNLFR